MIRITTNKTGIATSRDLAAEMRRGTEEFGPSSMTGPDEIERVHVVVAEESEPVGSIPPAAGGEAAPTEMTPQFLDKLGARLAFERTGARLYEGLLTKLAAYGSFDGGPTREELESHRADERSHFDFLREVIERLGGDPTATTPTADLEGVASQGVVALIHDARTNLLQSLEAMLVAELTDGACWEALIDAARSLGHDDLLPAFELALRRENEHLDDVKRWIRAGGLAKAQAPPAPQG
jgi:ferritin-like metal-binding protein YciE